jgi:hypothetical protein
MKARSGLNAWVQPGDLPWRGRQPLEASRAKAKVKRLLPLKAIRAGERYGGSPLWQPGGRCAINRLHSCQNGTGGVLVIAQAALWLKVQRKNRLTTAG